MTQSRYSAVAIALHWTIAALILANLWFGWQTHQLSGLAQYNVFQLHKSIGVTVLLLSLLRLGWRIAVPPPQLSGLTAWESMAARCVHWGFYLIMIGMPLTGWIVVSTSPLNIPTRLYHLVPWPHFPIVHTLAERPKAAVNHAFVAVHLWLAWGAILLLLLHLGAVAKHQILDRTPVVARMLPFMRTQAVAPES